MWRWKVLKNNISNISPTVEMDIMLYIKMKADEPAKKLKYNNILLTTEGEWKLYTKKDKEESGYV